MRRLLVWVVVLLAAALLAIPPPGAQAFPNGHAQARNLAPIFMPYNTAFLAKGAAASWNTMRLCAVRQGVDLYPSPSGVHPARTAYRSYHQQVILWRLYKSGLGNLAAYPGSSNHGLGLAVDVATVRMRTWIDNHGGRFGWSKRWSDAPSEWWHLRYRRGIWHRPNPGTSIRYPQLRRGSGGKCQQDAVREAQRRLGLRQDGQYGRGTERAVRRFERAHGLHVDGVVASNVWIKLRSASRGIPTRRAAVIAPVKAAGARPLVGQDVKAVQGLLNARLVELHRRQYRVKVTGVLDHRTVVAVKRFQRLRHLPVTGRVDNRTYQALLSAKVKASPKLHVSSGGARLVASFEGYACCPYRDAVGVWTTGYGHTGPDVFRLGHLSQRAALRLLRLDLDHFAKGVTVLVHVRITGHQYDALVSFAYNVGLGALRSSTLLRELNHRHYRRAADEFPKWDRAGGRVLLGLERRRYAERHLFLLPG